MRIVGLNKLKPREKFRFPANIEKELGIRGDCNVANKYTENRTQVRETYTEKVFLVEYLERGTSIKKIKNLKTVKCWEFPYSVLVIAKSKKK